MSLLACPGHAERLQLDAALNRIVDDRATDADWQTVLTHQDRLGRDYIREAAQDAALKLRKSRATALKKERVK